MKTMKRILHLLRPYTALIILTLVFSALSVGFMLFIPILVGNAIDLMIGKGQVDIPLLTSKVLSIVICAASLALSEWLLTICCNRLSFSCVRDLRTMAFEKITRLPLSYIDTHSSGETLNRVVADADSFADGMLMGSRQLITGVLTIIGTIVIMFINSTLVATVVVLLTPLSLFVASFISRRIYKYFHAQTAARSAQTAVIEEMIGHRRTVISLGMEQTAINAFKEKNESMRSASLLATFYSSLVNPSTRFVNNLVYALAALFGSLSVLAGGALTVGGLSCMLAYATQYTKPFNEISGVVTELQNAMACAENIFRLLDAPECTQDGTLTLENVHGQVDLDKVSFSYIKGRKLIEDLSLSVKPGMHVAIVGPSGCGKTTLINLLMRFYDTDSGEICIDGKNINHLTRKSLRTSYGMVLQDTWLKSGTIRDNIKIGRPDATDEEMIEAAKACHSHSFIRRMPDGYDTVIGEDGGNLSAGQKQLLCITRIMLALPPMLILDEATSNIDTRTERKIQDAFDKMMYSRSSFVVAHRLSTVKNSDLILVMRDGKVVESGTHSALLSQNGFYASIYNAQFVHQ